MLKSLIRGKFIGSRSVNNPPEHFVNNQVLTVGIRPYARERAGVGGLKNTALPPDFRVDVVADGLFLQDSGFSYLGSFRNPSP